MSVKWSPMEIQEMHFSITKKGYDPEEVRSFLMSMAEQIEILLRDREQLRKDFEMAREELLGHERREQILKDTLLTAQKLARDVKEQAEREGEVIVKESEIKAEKIFKETLEKVSDMEKQVRELRLSRHRFVMDLEQMLRRFERFLNEEMNTQEETSADVSAIYARKD